MLLWFSNQIKLTNKHQVEHIFHEHSLPDIQLMIEVRYVNTLCRIRIHYLRMSQWAPLYLFCIVEFLPKLQLHSKGSVQPPNIHPPNGMHWLQLGPSLEMHVYPPYLIIQWLIWYTIQYYMNKSLDLYISHEHILNLQNHKLVLYKLNQMNCFETIQPSKLEHHLHCNCT